MRLLGPASAPRTTVDINIGPASGGRAHQRFVTEMVPALWAAGLRYGVDPVGVVAQSAKETGWGNFGDKVGPTFFNTCGLKVRDVAEVLKRLGSTDPDHPLCHQQFWSWELGALAHVHHLRAYAGWPIDGELILSPRYVWVIGLHRLENWSDLGDGRWANPGVGYGAQVESIMRALQLAGS